MRVSKTKFSFFLIGLAVIYCCFYAYFSLVLSFFAPAVPFILFGAAFVILFSINAIEKFRLNYSDLLITAFFLQLILYFLFTSKSDSLSYLLNFFLGSLFYFFSKLQLRENQRAYWRYVFYSLLFACCILYISLIYQAFHPAYFNFLDPEGGNLVSLRYFAGFIIPRLTGLTVNPTFPANLFSIAIVMLCFSDLKTLVKVAGVGLLLSGIILTGSRFSILIILPLLMLYALRKLKTILIVVICVLVFVGIGFFKSESASALISEIGGAWGHVSNSSRLNYVFDRGFLNLLIGEGWFEGSHIKQFIQTGAYEQGNSLDSIFDSQVLWVIFQFGFIGFGLLTAFFIRILHLAVKSGESVLIILCLYFFICSFKLYPFWEKTGLLLSFITLGFSSARPHLKKAEVYS